MADNHLIYMDHSATTPVDPLVVQAMLPYFTEAYGNASSTHAHGRRAQQGLAAARRTIAELFNASPSEVVFTGCGSESDRIALRGVMWAARQSGRGNHMITCNIEHKAVLETARQLRELSGFDVTVLPVDHLGRIDLNELEAAIRPDTVLISIMTANNEIGAFQPFRAIGDIAREYGVLYHTDAVQAVSSIPLDFSEWPVDLVSIAPHKLYGPKGVGVLLVRSGVDILSPAVGGGQEGGLRAGTENVAFAAGAAEALRLAVVNRKANVAHDTALRDRLIAGVLSAFPEDCQLTGHPTERLAHHASFAFRDLSGNDLLIQLDVAGVSAGSGSACSSGDPKPSAVLEALGLGPRWTLGGLRLTVGRQNSFEDVDYVLQALVEAVTTLRSFTAMFA